MKVFIVDKENLEISTATISADEIPRDSAKNTKIYRRSEKIALNVLLNLIDNKLDRLSFERRLLEEKRRDIKHRQKQNIDSIE